MSLYLTEEEVSGLIDIRDAIAAMEHVGESMAKGETIFLPRVRLRMSHGFFHFMPASLEEEGYFGYKAYTSFNGIARFLVFLFDNHSGELKAMIEGDRLGQLRTGAASAVAAKFLMRENSSSFGLIGSGYQAETQLAAALAVHKFSSVKVFSRNFEHAEKFCKKLQSASKIKLEAVKEIEEAASADVVTTVTNATSQVLFVEMVNPGCHINAVGGNMLVKRELDEKLVESANLIVIDSREQGEKECGDFLPSLEKGKIHWSDVYEYKDIFHGNARRKNDSDITLFKSQGIAPWDIALAKVVYERALGQKVGKQISV
jgi:alanine dehydrogenase